MLLDDARALLFFFFSSRRRHTRWTGDWSSDVCSSDLSAHGPDRASHEAAAAAELAPQYLADTLAFMFETRYLFEPTAFRSEERRVGKECRSRRWPYDQKKKKNITASLDRSHRRVTETH